jgi:hypothetical protein
MKKNVLALSITAALFGLTGGAQAMTGTLGGATAASDLALNGDGTGHILLVPYFSTQSGNATLINLVNTNTTIAKAVKVRFRGAANSDDIFDFQVFLSPGDVWTANVSKGADGRSVLTTGDASCTKPAKATLNATPFVTSRLDSTLTADQKANGTREGYIEIFTMADIPKASNAAATKDGVDNTKAGVIAAGDNPLYTAVKHVSGVAPCTGAAWTALDGDGVGGGADIMTWNAAAATNSANSFGLVPPTTGLMANWTIINTVGAAAWSGEAFAIESRAGAPAVAANGNVVYWPQTGFAPTNVNFYTADPLLRSGAAAVGRVYSVDAAGTTYTAASVALPAVTAGDYDLPDVSTPYTATATPAAAAVTDPLLQARSVTAAIAATSATNEFLTTSSISAATDWVFSMPTRRYNVAFAYGFTASATDDGRRFTDLQNAGTFAQAYFSGANTLVATSTNGNGRQVCVKGITPTAYDREETTLASSASVVVSPSTPADPLSFCGEAAVLSINNGGIIAAGTGALKASVAVKDLDVTYREGWMKLATPAATATPGGGATIQGLPVLGSSFTRAVGGTAGQTFGAAYKHRFAR